MSGDAADRANKENQSPGRFSFRSPLKNRCNIDWRLPHQLVDHFCDIDFKALAEQGITKVCLDVDNTLMPQKAEVVDPAVVRHLAHAREQGYIEGICLISNVIWKGKRTQRLKRVAEVLDVEHYYGANFWTRKPSPKPFRWAIETLGSEPSQMAMIGDQIFADIVGGNKMGFHTVLVKPMSSDHWTTLIIGRRWRESTFLKNYQIRP
jgi:HAD superfamily phosphatase (TIGR01668 family)